MAWKMLLPVELCKPLIVSATTIKSRATSENRNTGPKCFLKVEIATAKPHQPILPQVVEGLGFEGLGSQAVARLS
mgnify:CR=1 FL=1